ncbi:MAG: serine hydrolase domain-containing protein, partial [Bacteroidota bacterium]
GSSVNLFGQKTISKRTLSKVEKVFSDISENTPGYAIAVIEDGEYLYQKGFGCANLEHHLPITTNTAFNIASLSKQFTAACMALLILDGKCHLEDPVSKYLPDFPEYAKEVQIQHLVYMCSGLPEYYNQDRSGDRNWSSLEYFNVDTAIAAVFQQQELKFQPGSQWDYSNTNYMLLTRIVESISGKRFAEFAQEELFAPLKMDNTLVNDDIFTVIPNRAMGYNYRDNENTDWLLEYGFIPEAGSGFLQIHRNAAHYGGSGIFSTIEDLKRWNDNFQTRDFGGDAFYELMHRTQSFDHSKSNDAFGLYHGDFNGTAMVAYEGGDWGYSSYMMRFPESNITVICLSNLGTGNAASHAFQVIDILLDNGVLELR